MYMLQIASCLAAILNMDVTLCKACAWIIQLVTDRLSVPMW